MLQLTCQQKNKQLAFCIATASGDKTFGPYHVRTSIGVVSRRIRLPSSYHPFVVCSDVACRRYPKLPHKPFGINKSSNNCAVTSFHNKNQIQADRILPARMKTSMFTNPRLRCGHQKIHQLALKLRHGQPCRVSSSCLYLRSSGQSPKLICRKPGQSTAKPLNTLPRRLYTEFFQFGSQRSFFVTILRRPPRANAT